MQIELLQIERIKTWSEQWGRADHEADEHWKGDNADVKKWLMHFGTFIPGANMEDVLDAVEHVEDVSIHCCSRSGNGFNIAVESPIEDWRRVKNLLKVALTPLQKAAEVKDKPVVDVAKLLEFEAFELRLGYGLVKMADGILAGINDVRMTIANDLGFLLPACRVRDDMKLEANHYSILINEKEVATGELLHGHLLIFSPPPELVIGVPTKDPVYGEESRWVAEDQIGQVESLKLTGVTAEIVLTTHLSEVVKKHAGLLLRREQVFELLTGVMKHSPQLVNSVIPSRVEVHQLHELLSTLLENGRSIKDLVRILEAVGSADTKMFGLLYGHVQYRAFSQGAK